MDSNSKSGQNETQNNNSKKRNYVITRQTDGSEQPLITTVMQPEIRGVVVVCDGASDAATRARLTELISVALDIGYNKICITKMSSE